jgi:hypothetical protein
MNRANLTDQANQQEQDEQKEQAEQGEQGERNEGEERRRWQYLICGICSYKHMSHFPMLCHMFPTICHMFTTIVLVTVYYRYGTYLL